MRHISLFALLLMLTGCRQSPTVIHAKWNGQQFTCPIGMDVWADEREAIAGKDDYVYCVAVREGKR